jgi:hypothetical protein
MYFNQVWSFFFWVKIHYEYQLVCFKGQLVRKTHSNLDYVRYVGPFASLLTHLDSILWMVCYSPYLVNYYALHSR